MSGRVPIRVPTGAPATAFLSRPAPATAHEAPPGPPEPEPLVPPKVVATAEVPERSATPPPATATAAGSRFEARTGRSQPQQEPGVRFQFFLPADLAKLVDAERDRRKAAGYRGRGKSDYTAIFRDLVEKHLR